MDRIQLSIRANELGIGRDQCVEILVNGQPLLETIREAELPHVGDLAGEYAGLHPTADVVPGLTFLAVPSTSEAPSVNRVRVLRCNCGDLSCSYVTAVVNVSGSVVVWSDFGSSMVDGKRLDADVYRGLGPYHFDGGHYEAEIRQLRPA